MGFQTPCHRLALMSFVVGVGSALEVCRWIHADSIICEVDTDILASSLRRGNSCESYDDSGSGYIGGSLKAAWVYSYNHVGSSWAG